jgi:hypothetical protein
LTNCPRYGLAPVEDNRIAAAGVAQEANPHGAHTVQELGQEAPFLRVVDGAEVFGVDVVAEDERRNAHGLPHDINLLHRGLGCPSQYVGGAGAQTGNRRDALVVGRPGHGAQAGSQLIRSGQQTSGHGIGEAVAGGDGWRGSGGEDLLPDGLGPEFPGNVAFASEHTGDPARDRPDVDGTVRRLVERLLLLVGQEAVEGRLVREAVGDRDLQIGETSGAAAALQTNVDARELEIVGEVHQVAVEFPVGRPLQVGLWCARVHDLLVRLAAPHEHGLGIAVVLVAGDDPIGLAPDAKDHRLPCQTGRWQVVCGHRDDAFGAGELDGLAPIRAGGHLELDWRVRLPWLLPARQSGVGEGIGEHHLVAPRLKRAGAGGKGSQETAGKVQHSIVLVVGCSFLNVPVGLVLGSSAGGNRRGYWLVGRLYSRLQPVLNPRCSVPFCQSPSALLDSSPPTP